MAGEQPLVDFVANFAVNGVVNYIYESCRIVGHWRAMIHTRGFRCERRKSGTTRASVARGAMALSKLSGDEQGVVFIQLCNALEPRIALALSSVNHELWATQALRQQLRADHEAATALCRKVGIRSCKELREAKEIFWSDKRLTAAEWATLGSLGSVLPALESLRLIEISATCCPVGVQQLAARLGAGALLAVIELELIDVYVGDIGASALAAALGRGALPRLKYLVLYNAATGDAGLVALAPALRRLPALEKLSLMCNPFGDEGVAVLVAPPPPSPAGAPPPTGVLRKLKSLDLAYTEIHDAGCLALAAALDSGALPALLSCVEGLSLNGTAVSAAAFEAPFAALAARYGLHMHHLATFWA